MGGFVEYVDLSAPDGRGLWRLESSSTTVYYVDARSGFPPLLMRAAGRSGSSTSSGDYRWVRLLSLMSGPRIVNGDRELARDEIDVDDMRPWVLRVGSRHRFEWETMLSDDWMIQRVLETIERLEEMPPPGRLTRDASDPGAIPRGDL